MEAARGKKQFPLRVDEELLAYALEKAKSQRRSLNNYIEYLLYKDVGNIPNEVTKNAIDEVRNNDDLEEIKDIRSFMDSL